MLMYETLITFIKGNQDMQAMMHQDPVCSAQQQPSLEYHGVLILFTPHKDD